MILTTEQIALVESIPGWGGWMKKMDDAEAEGRAAGEAYVKNIPEYAGMNEEELDEAIKVWNDSNVGEVGCPYTDNEELRNEWEAAFVAGGSSELWSLLVEVLERPLKQSEQVNPSSGICRLSNTFHLLSIYSVSLLF